MGESPGSSEDTPPTISLADFQTVDLRVATVLEAAPHPNAEGLLVLRIRVGERTKQVVAGLGPCRDHKPIGIPRASSDGPIIVVDNLQPAVLRGERSEGMLLAVRDGDDRCAPRPGQAGVRREARLLEAALGEPRTGPAYAMQ